MCEEYHNDIISSMVMNHLQDYDHEESGTFSFNVRHFQDNHGSSYHSGAHLDHAKGFARSESKLRGRFADLEVILETFNS